ncbi:prefoldin subunit alpha [Candidatus Pacearchaeota archaeon]|nr:prefoldin subunit alpha [Candidatus Pacearchaeota archaeon]
MNQEIMFKLQMFEQQIKQLQQQMQAVEETSIELSTLNIGLDDLIGAEGKEVMAPLGRGIFAKAKLISEDLIVDIGGKNLVKKTIPQTKEIIEGQLEKLDAAKKELDAEIEKVNKSLTESIIEAQGQMDGGCGGECQHDESGECQKPEEDQCDDCKKE